MNRCKKSRSALAGSDRVLHRDLANADLGVELAVAGFAAGILPPAELLNDELWPLNGPNNLGGYTGAGE